MASTIETMTASSLSIKTPTSARQFQALFPKVIPFEVRLTESSIAGGVTSVASITVPGAELGDIVLVTFLLPPSDIRLDAVVTAANTVTLRALNLETTDANTTMSGGKLVKGVVLGFNVNP